jgi:hypothetical protein
MFSKSRTVTRPRVPVGKATLAFLTVCVVLDSGGVLRIRLGKVGLK